MAAIYHKALLRKDFSGSVKKETKDDSEKGKGKEKGGAKEGEKDKKSASQAADVGKIVNLMSGDATRVRYSVIIDELFILTSFSFPLGLVRHFRYVHGIRSSFRFVDLRHFSLPSLTYIHSQKSSSQVSSSSSTKSSFLLSTSVFLT